MDKKEKLGELSNEEIDVAKSTNLKASSFILGNLEHPNQMPFEGILTWFDAPSDNAPNGSRGRKVVIPSEVGIPALTSLKGMAINYVSGSMNGHNPQNKIGVITDAFAGEPQEDGAVPVYVEGYIYAYDFEDAAIDIKASQSALGFSYETARTLVEDGIWNGEQVAIVRDLGWFTGASVLYKLSAAYTRTSLVASADEETTKEVRTLDKEALIALKEAIKHIDAITDQVMQQYAIPDQDKETASVQAESDAEVSNEPVGDEEAEGDQLKAEAEVTEETEVKAEAEVEVEAEPVVEEEVKSEVEVEEDVKAEEEVQEESPVEGVEVKASAELEALKVELAEAKKELAEIKASTDLQASKRKSIAHPQTLLSKFELDEKDEATQLLASIDNKEELSVEERLALKFAVRDQQRKSNK